jgi:hypothetical protein
MTEIWIKDKLWTIDEVTRREMDRESGDKGVLGICCFAPRMIDVVVPQRQLGHTVAHELAHAIIYEYGIKFRDIRQEEQYIGKMEPVLYELARIFPKKYK